MTTAVASARPLEDQVHAFFGAALGAAVAYSLYGQDVTSLAVGGLAGYFVHPIAVSEVKRLHFIPHIVRPLLPAAAAGAFVGYQLNGGDPAMAGAYAAGAAAVQYGVTWY